MTTRFESGDQVPVAGDSTSPRLKPGASRPPPPPFSVNVTAKPFSREPLVDGEGGPLKTADGRRRLFGIRPSSPVVVKLSKRKKKLLLTKFAFHCGLEIVSWPKDGPFLALVAESTGEVDGSLRSDCRRARLVAATVMGV